MHLKKALSLLLLLCGTLLFSQQMQLSALSKVSLLTVGTADELHSKFGHSAIRIEDPTIGMDLVYNYGMFDFDDPNFYLKFTRGKLNYRIARETYKQFIRIYEYENRWVKEQVLDMPNKDKKALFHFLENNLLPENRYYKYDFLFDNCATRIPDALQKATGGNLVFNEDYLKEHYTFRALIHQNLDLNSWSNFGIDLALGSVIDKEATTQEHMFLPSYVFDQLKHTKINGKPLVYSEEELLAQKPVAKNSNFFSSPMFWLSFLLIIVLGITYLDYKKQARSRWLDFILFFITGAAGLLILFLWFLTDHQATKLNFNAFWAFGPNIIFAFILLKRQLPKWFKTVLYILLFGLLLTILIWLLKVQVFSPLILFFLLALGIRYLYLITFLKHSNLVSGVANS